MAEYSEATRRVFERSLELLEGKIPDAQLEALRTLVAAGKLGDLSAVEEIVRPKERRDGDR